MEVNRIMCLISGGYSMKLSFIFIIALFCSALMSNAQHFSANTGFTYIQQYPDGSNIRNNFFPNMEGGASFAFVNAKFLKVSTGLGVTTHNFGLHDVENDRTYNYLRLEPYGQLSVQGNLSEENTFVVHGIYARFKAGFYNQWCFNPSWQAGLVSKSFGKFSYYVQFTKLFYYKIPDNNFLLFDYTNNYYPLGNERWSITAGVLWRVFGKDE